MIASQAVSCFNNTMLYERQKLLLALLESLGGEAGHLDFQKLLFLYCTEWENPPSYEFVPYKFGGFSFTSYDDIRKLLRDGYIRDDDRKWSLTECGKNITHTRPEAVRKTGMYLKRWSGMRGDTLLSSVYKKYPYYASRSEVAGRILSDDPPALRAIESARHAIPSAKIHTIGYEGYSLEGYLNRLIKSGVDTLYDVRRNPMSRKYGFSRGTLSNACESVGIAYISLPELGIASEERYDLKTQEDYDALFDIYTRTTLSNQNAALNRIADFVFHGHIVALTCYEHLPQQCHRHCVAEVLERSYGEEFKPKHL